MADVTGALRHEFGGRTYCLRITMLGLADLQDKYGEDIGGFLSGKFDTPEDGSPAVIPPFRIMVDMVKVALMKGENMTESEALDLADDMTTANRDLGMLAMQAAFPPEKAGNAPARKRKARA